MHTCMQSSQCRTRGDMCITPGLSIGIPAGWKDVCLITVLKHTLTAPVSRIHACDDNTQVVCGADLQHGLVQGSPGSVLPGRIHARFLR